MGEPTWFVSWPPFQWKLSLGRNTRSLSRDASLDRRASGNPCSHQQVPLGPVEVCQQTARRGRGRRRKRQSARRRALQERGQVAVGFDDEHPLATFREVDGWKIGENRPLPTATDEDRAQLAELLHELGAPLLHSGISFYRFTRLGEQEERRRRPGLRQEQFHADILQAMGHTQPEVWQKATGTRARVGEAQRLVPLVVHALTSPSGDADQDDLVRLVQGETRFIRNWAHPRQLLLFLKKLFEPLDSQYRASIGLTLTQLVELIGAITSAQNERFRRFVGWHNELARSPRADWPAVARRYWPELESTNQLASIGDDSADMEMLPHDPLPSLFQWSAEELGRLIGAKDLDGLAAVLEAWSLRPGSIDSSERALFLLDTPVWAHPFVRLGDDRYFLAFPGILFSFGLQLIDAACRLDPATFRRYVENKWRSRFLERQLKELVETAFPDAEVLANNSFPGGQNDLMVRADDFVLVFEAKSGRVSRPARRGAIESLRRALREIVLEGSDQAYRFIAFLQEAQRNGVAAQLSDGRQIAVQGVAEYIPCVVHLEPLGIVGADTKRIATAFGANQEDRLPAMAMGLADLETVFRLLQTPSERLHYLYRRRQLERFRRYAADELDLLAPYFENQLIFVEQFSGGELLLYGRSTPVDRWLSNDQELQPVSRPRRRMSQRFQAALNRVANQRRQGWMRIALVLQDVQDEVQHDFEHQLRRAGRLHRKTREAIRTALTDLPLTEE